MKKIIFVWGRWQLAVMGVEAYFVFNIFGLIKITSQSRCKNNLVGNEEVLNY